MNRTFACVDRRCFILLAVCRPEGVVNGLLIAHVLLRPFTRTAFTPECRAAAQIAHASPTSFLTASDAGELSHWKILVLRWMRRVVDVHEVLIERESENPV